MGRTSKNNQPQAEIVLPDVERASVQAANQDTLTDSRTPTPNSSLVPPTQMSRPGARSLSIPHATASSSLSTNTAAPSASETSTGFPPIKWVDNNGIKFPFPADDMEYDGNDTFDPIQFKTNGIVSAAYLSVGALSHTIKFTIPKEDVKLIKDLIASSPDFHPSEEFHWPFVDEIATANNKDDLDSAFEHVYDGRNKEIGDLDEEDLIPAHRIRPEVKVQVEYTPTLWAPKKSKSAGPSKFGSGGCSLKLMGVVLLEEKYNFQSPKKRRRME